MTYQGLLHPESLALKQSNADPYLCRRHSNTVLSQSLWGLWVLVHTRFVWALWMSLVGMGFDSKRYFAPPTVLLGLLLCPWTWGISSKSLLCHTATLSNSVKLWAMLFRATQDGRVMVESSEKKRGPLEKWMASHFSILALRTPWTVWKSKKIGHWKMNSPICYWRSVEK